MSLRVSLIHSCFDQAVGNPRPKNCRCKFRVTKEQATQLVEDGLASWLIVDWKKDAGGQSIPVTSWNLVWGAKQEEEPGATVRSALAAKTPRVQTIEKAHIHRSTDPLMRKDGKWGYLHDKVPEDAVRIEEWGRLARGVISDLVVPAVDDPYGPGRPILTYFNDDRT
jgi:phospholipase C